MSRTVQIGNATLILGDCREVMPTLGHVDAVITDPPYGIGLGAHDGANDTRPRHLTKQGYAGYEDTPENFREVIVPAVRYALKIAKRSMVFGVPPSMWALPAPDAMGGVFLPSAIGSHAWGFSSFAHCLLYGTAAELNKGRKATGVSSTEKAEPSEHPTPKPLSWMLWAVNLGSAAGEVVLDPFMGSGTTGVACWKLGRKFIGIEVEPKYFDLACKRIEDAQRQADMFIGAA